MTSEEFVQAFHKEKEEMLSRNLSFDEETLVGNLIADLKLDSAQREVLKKILDLSLTDCLYAILLGLDGAGTIGGHQVDCTILDQNGNELTGGEIESKAWEYFHG